MSKVKERIDIIFYKIEDYFGVFQYGFQYGDVARKNIDHSIVVIIWDDRHISKFKH